MNRGVSLVIGPTGETKDDEVSFATSQRSSVDSAKKDAGRQMATAMSLASLTVKQGDEVTVVVTNIDEVEDLTHGFSVCNHDVNFVITGKDTNSMTFTVPDAGVFWYYCSWFCHALHLEMRGRLIVEA